MDREEAAGRIRQTGIIAIIRAGRPVSLIDAVEALRAGGVDVIEVTMNTPGALDVIAEVKARYKDEVLFGAGTVLGPEAAREAILAGADFIVSPALIPGLIEVCRTNAKVVIPGCFTPTEILSAWEKGADFIKVFPADVCGPAYIKAVLAPLDRVPLIPTGGVNRDNIGEYFKAGVAAVGVGGCLVSREILDNRDFPMLTEQARRFREEVVRARG